MAKIETHLQNEVVWKVSTEMVKLFLETTILGKRPASMSKDGWGTLLHLYARFEIASVEEIRQAAQVCETCSNGNDAIGGTALGLYVEAERRETKN